MLDTINFKVKKSLSFSGKSRMSLFFNWWWDAKPAKNDEQERKSYLQRALLEEMRQHFIMNNQTKNAERKYDYDVIYTDLMDRIKAIGAIYAELDWENGKYIFPNAERKKDAWKAIENYYDYVVRHKEFLEDQPQLKNELAAKLFEYGTNEKFLFDWHYWQLFRRNLTDDLTNQTKALEEIKHGVCSDDEDDDSSDYEIL